MLKRDIAIVAYTAVLRFIGPFEYRLSELVHNCRVILFAANGKELLEKMQTDHLPDLVILVTGRGRGAGIPEKRFSSG